VQLLTMILPIFFAGIFVAAQVPAAVALSNLASWAVLLHLPDLANYLTAAMATSTTALSNLASWAIQFHLLDLAEHLTPTINLATTWTSAVGFIVSTVLTYYRLQ
jgi:hypothetical protein